MESGQSCIHDDNEMAKEKRQVLRQELKIPVEEEDLIVTVKLFNSLEPIRENIKLPLDFNQVLD